MEYNDPPGYSSLKPLNRLRQKDLGKLLLIKPNLDSVWSINNTELSGSRGGGWAHSEKYFILSYSNIRTWRDCWHSWKYLTRACRSREGVCSWLLLLLWSEGGESRHFDLLRWTLHHQMVIVPAHHSERLRGVRWTLNSSNWGPGPHRTDYAHQYWKIIECPAGLAQWTGQHTLQPLQNSDRLYNELHFLPVNSNDAPRAFLAHS